LGYYIRVLSPGTAAASLASLQQAAAAFGASITGDVDSPQSWVDLVIVDRAGREICVIERNRVADGSLGAEEIEEFRDEVASCEPASAACWLASYLNTVRTIYAFQVLNSVYEGDGWDLLGAVKTAVWSSVGGIIQADGEGFTNEDGYHILWQFSDDVDGEWWVAVLIDGGWRKFKMDLASPAHRAAFKAGRVPDGVELAT
jgi:hypothetical protein